MCSATAEIITRIKDAAFEIGPSHVQNAWSVKLPSVKTVGLQEQRKTHIYALLEECYNQIIVYSLGYLF